MGTSSSRCSSGPTRRCGRPSTCSQSCGDGRGRAAPRCSFAPASTAGVRRSPTPATSGSRSTPSPASAPSLMAGRSLSSHTPSTAPRRRACAITAWASTAWRGSRNPKPCIRCGPTACADDSRRCASEIAPRRRRAASLSFPQPEPQGATPMVSQTALRYDEQDWQPRPTLSGAEYTSDGVYDEERERIWWGDWVCIGREEELPNPGDYIVRDLTGESVFVARDERGSLHGFYNVCSHRGTKFLDDEPASGHVRKAFTCPYHGWVYNLQGELIGTPNVQQDELFDRAAYPLYRFPVEEYAGFLFVNLSRDPVRPLREHLAEGAESIMMFDRFRMDELRIGVRLVYEVDANWKILVENYNECLHCPQVHPELVQVIPLFRKGEVWDGETNDGGNQMVAGATSFTATGSSDLPKFPDLLEPDYGM